MTVQNACTEQTNSVELSYVADSGSFCSITAKFALQKDEFFRQFLKCLENIQKILRQIRVKFQSINSKGK